MPRIFDNIAQPLLPALRDTLRVAYRADFCVGYLNLRGWRTLDEEVERLAGGDGACCRLLVGMQRPQQAELREWLGANDGEHGIDNQTALRMKRLLAQELRDQLMQGMPSDVDEAGLRRLAHQLRDRKVVVRLFLRHQLHAKLYLLYRNDPVNPIVGYVGSSNLTFAGLRHQGELNVDVVDEDSGQKLSRWFEDRWNDRWCVDISDDLVTIIEESWAREQPLSPYHVYLKIAYHLSEEARAGLAEYRLPRDLDGVLFEFQKAAVQIAAHHLQRRGGVLIGDVVGLGKTLMATAVARVMEEDLLLETLILCPKGLVPMWEEYRDRYRLRARVMSLSRVEQDLPDLHRFRVVLIDESHNLRNREGRRYLVIRDYLRKNESKVILLSATPYNKTYLDLANQLRLFVPEDEDIGIRPERLLKELGEPEFIRRHQCGLRTLAAFEKSEYADDWRELMRLYLVRRTRSFIQANYARVDETGRRYLPLRDERMYFPRREPRTVKFSIDDDDPTDAYAMMYATPVVDTINALRLPRYGLGNYIQQTVASAGTPTEKRVMGDLSRSGQRLMGFCRTNLFKRLESSGHAFYLSLERHALRNFVFLHALDNELPVPIGTQDVGLLDTRVNDEDSDWLLDDDESQAPGSSSTTVDSDALRRRAGEAYQDYAGRYQKRFKWLPALYFIPELADDLRRDAESILEILTACGRWRPEQDHKLARLADLIARDHPGEKVLVFSQFADTVDYLARELKARGIADVAAVTGDTPDPTAIAWRFSPNSNGKQGRIGPDGQINVLVATDLLSEGQNLQDARIVVNYDLPWAIIRLIQRVGRVDRIGQQATDVLCYSFLPADGVDRILRLRDRVRQRLRQNAEVVGTDEAFFDDDQDNQAVRDLFTEKAGILDDEKDTEVDLASQALQIWKNAVDDNPALARRIEALPNVVFATRPHLPGPDQPDGVLVFVRTSQDYNALAWMDSAGSSFTESQFAILRAAECTPDTPALERRSDHHALVAAGVKQIGAEERTVGGQLGRPSGARFRAYERLKHHAEKVRGTLFDRPELHSAVEDIYRYPLRQAVADTLNRMLRTGATDEELAARVIELRDGDRLSVIDDAVDAESPPRIICSLGLASTRVRP